MIIAKPPSADLWAGQTDEGELGFTYEEVDKLLYLLVDQRYRPEECVEAGFDEKFVRQVFERIRKNQFKRITASNSKTQQPHGRIRFPLPARLGNLIKLHTAKEFGGINRPQTFFIKDNT